MELVRWCVDKSMALCFLLFAGCPSVWPASMSETVEAEAIGATCEDALQQAKLVAAETIAGSFIRSERSLKGDSVYSEKISEYNGGVVTAFKILKSDGGRPCSVLIRADVAVDKLQFSGSKERGEVDLGSIGELLKNRRQGDAVLQMLVYRPSYFTVVLSNVSFRPSYDGAQVSFDIENISFKKEWVSEIKALLSVQEVPVSYRKQGIRTIGNSLVSLLSLPFTKNSQKQRVQDPDSSICFRSEEELDKIDCYAGPMASELINLLGAMPFQAVISDESGKSYPIGLAKRMPLLTYYTPTVPHLAEDGFKRYRFLLAEPSNLPQREEVTVKNGKLTPGIKVSVKVGQLELNQ